MREEYLTVLSPVWGFTFDEMKPIMDAVERGDRQEIEEHIRKFEELINTTDRRKFPNSDKYEAYIAEMRAKLHVLNAIVTGKGEEWAAAAEAYQELAEIMNRLALSCGSTEDIAKVMFEADMERAVELGCLCLLQIPARREEAKKRLFAMKARRAVQRIAPNEGYIITDEPLFPEGRSDICIVRHSTENGVNYGFDTIYVVWLTPEGRINCLELINSRDTRDYIWVKDAKIEESMLVKIEESMLVIDVWSSGSFSGQPWTRRFSVSLADIGLH
jgi:hypothetical protein